MSDLLNTNFAYAFGKPRSSAKFRVLNEDFIVNEGLGFAPSGEGEHLFVRIKKEGENTSWVAEKLAAYFNVKTMDVSYCGKKDRNAITTQWFSVYLPGVDEEVDWAAFINQFELSIEVLEESRHSRKLRRGTHDSNSFTIRLRDLSDVDDVASRLEKIKKEGVPNYFGEQRFGRDESNLAMAQAWIEEGLHIRSRNKRGMVMSAARSYLFNRVLSDRIEQGNWLGRLEGDVDNELPTGPLWGRGRPLSTGETLGLESQALDRYATWCEHMEHVGLNQERRVLVLNTRELQWQFEDSDVVLSFRLAPGQFATSVLRELCHFE